MALPLFSSSPVCNRCGRCCFYQLDGKWKKCKNLVVHGRLTSCRIWNDPTRVGREIDKGIFCNRIEDLNVTYVGCPYNPGKPVIRVPVAPFFD